MIQQRFRHADFIRHMFGPSVAIGWADPKSPMPRLLGDEVLAIEHVTAARAREFAAGRAAARAAMEQLGHLPRPVLQGPDRAPVWPAGLTGSITHTAQDALAVVTEDPAVRALGLDLEPAQPLDPGLWREVCTDEDLLWLGTLGPSQRGYFAKLIFSAKEAAYKAQYQITRRLIGFDSMHLAPDLENRTFTAELRIDLPNMPKGTRLDGKFAILGRVFATSVELRDT